MTLPGAMRSSALRSGSPDVPAATRAGQAVNKGQLDAALAGVTASGVADGDKGDIVVSSAGTVWTVDARAVTPAKMSAAAAASRLLGRGSAAGGGDFQEITLAAQLAFTGTVLGLNFKASDLPDDSGVAGFGPKQADSNVTINSRIAALEALTANIDGGSPSGTFTGSAINGGTP